MPEQALDYEPKKKIGLDFWRASICSIAATTFCSLAILSIFGAAHEYPKPGGGEADMALLSMLLWAYGLFSVSVSLGIVGIVLEILALASSASRKSPFTWVGFSAMLLYVIVAVICLYNYLI